MTDELSIPARTALYPCCCRIRIGTSPSTGKLVYSYCGAVVHGPDQPICTACIANGHPEDPGFDPALVPTARRQP